MCGIEDLVVAQRAIDDRVPLEHVLDQVHTDTSFRLSACFRTEQIPPSAKHDHERSRLTRYLTARAARSAAAAARWPGPR